MSQRSVGRARIPIVASLICCALLSGCSLLVDPGRHPQASALAASALQLSVDPAYAGQSITATATPAAREDGQVPTHAFAWELLEGAACPGGQGTYDGPNLPTEATCAGQRWQVTATPQLSERFVGPPTARAVEVRPLPGAPNVTFLPTSPYEKQPVIVNADQVPADDQITHRCVWTLVTPVEGCAAEKTFTSCILPADATCGNEDWQVVVTPQVPGGLTGTPATVPLNDIRPQPEGPTELFFSPYLDVLDIVAEATSPLIDGIEADQAYTWTLLPDAPCTPEEPNETHSGDTLPSTYTCTGQRWRVDVRPTYQAIPPIPGRSAFQIIEIEAAPPAPVITFFPKQMVNTLQGVLGLPTPPMTPWGSQNWVVGGTSGWTQKAPCSGNCLVIPGLILDPANTETGDVFTFSVTHCFVDARTGICHPRPPVSGDVTVINEPATLTLAGLSLYAPRVDDTIRAYAAGYADPVEGDDPTAGSTDPDDFYRRASYRWLIDDVPISTAVCGGPATSGGDVCDLRTVDPAPGSNLKVRALPYDGVTENDAGAIELGPYPLQPATIGWRKRSPSLNESAFVTAFDPTHERFLILETDGSLWEWTKALGFVALSPSGLPPAFKTDKLPVHVRTAYDDEAKLMLWVGVDTSDQLVLYSLDVAERGREAWQRIAAAAAPPPVCMSAVSVEPTRGELFLYGGLWPCAWTLEAADNRIDTWDGFASNQIHSVNYAGANPAWQFRGKIFSSERRLFGATAVPHPSKAEHVLLLGGLTTLSGTTFSRGGGNPQDILDVDLGYSGGVPNPSSTSTGFRLPEDRLGVAAYVHDGKVSGGLGFSSREENDDPFWTFDPDGASLTLLSPEDFAPAEDYARFGRTSLAGAVFGAAGVIDGEGLLHLGESFDPEIDPDTSLSRFRLARRIDRAGEDTWRVAYSSSREQAVPRPAVTGGFDGANAIFGGASLDPATGHWGAYDTELQRWQKLCDGGGAPCAADYEVVGLDTTAQASGGGFYVVGGTDTAGTYRSMRPRRFRNGTWTTLGPTTGCPGPNCPLTRTSAKLFETGCATQEFGAFGFKDSNNASALDVWTYDGSGWDLTAPWQAGGPGLSGSGDLAFDGQRYVVQLVHGFSFVHISAAVLDACAGDPRWESAVVATPDGEPFVRPGVTRSALFRIWDSPVTFAYSSGDGSVWLLRETGNKTYVWEPYQDTGNPRLAVGAMLWDASKRRILNYGNDGFALWELLLPESAFE